MGGWLEGDNGCAQMRQSFWGAEAEPKPQNSKRLFLLEQSRDVNVQSKTQKSFCLQGTSRRLHVLYTKIIMYEQVIQMNTQGTAHTRTQFVILQHGDETASCAVANLEMKRGRFYNES